jgi:nitrous oxide reductase
MERIVMPSKDAKRAADQGRRMSRRSLLQGAATAGAAGLAVTALGAAPAFAATSKPAEHSAEQLPDGPITVHVRNVRTGDIEIFAGTRETRLRDKDLASQIARAIR